MLIGYARVSTQDQNLELQHHALLTAGCERVYEDRSSGARAERRGLTQALEVVRAGDTLVVWKLDRLGRSVKHLVDLVGDLAKRDVNFKSLTDSIDTGTPSGRFFFHIMASLAQMERELMVERTQAGLQAARRLGRVGGRRRQMTDSKISAARKLLGEGVAPRDVAKDLGVSIATLYRWLPAASTPAPSQTEPAASPIMRQLGKPATALEREESRERLLRAAETFRLPLVRGADLEKSLSGKDDLKSGL